ncbi:MAG: DUF2336 domain-containing protein [Alphaproteobacteria bacterium]|nr:MAG: DUF2336 domain-containing protein [Alphaproteobacteria bacterium]
MSGSVLSAADVARLLEEPSGETRAETARKVGSYFRSGELSERERKLAEEIFRAMVRDAEVRVRKALADTLAESPDLPKDVAKSLAQDVEEVALPVIELSDVLSDEDLIEIVRTKGEAHQIAVARRPKVSARVSDVLADEGSERVVSTLVGNEGAEIAEETFGKVIEKFKDSPAVQEKLVSRSALPLVVAERLVSIVSENLRTQLVTRHQLSDAMATDLVMETRERATVGLLNPGIKAPDVIELVDQLHRNRRLTPTLIVRALCMGDMTFFEAALARRAGIPIPNAFQLIHDKGRLGLRKLCQKAGIPDSLIKMVEIGVAIGEELTETGGDDRERFRQVMIERVITQLDQELDADNLDYLIGKLGRRKAA